MPPDPHTVTELLDQVQRGNATALDELIPLVYGELKALAARYLRAERPDHTLQPTALVHECFLRLVEQRNASWNNRAHFFAIAAQAMRRILVDHARHHRAEKRGGSASAITLDENLIGASAEPLDVEWVSDAVERLARLDERQARLVELRFFGGLTIEETATALGISPATVKREWLSAKAWLQRELSGHEGAT